MKLFLQVQLHIAQMQRYVLGDVNFIQTISNARKVHLFS